MSRAHAAMLLAAALAAGCGGPNAGAPDESSWVEPTTGMTFTRIEAGRFVMGSPPEEPQREDQERQHEVRIAHPFWLGVHEVTQAEWTRVMGEDPSNFHDSGGQRPVEEVTWIAVQDFLRRLSSRDSGSRFRLPTEAEWEYGCRAGTTTAYSVGATLDPTQANIAPSLEETAAGRGETKPVGSFPPNVWGLHDMHGNVWEWTADEHCPYGDDATGAAASCGSPLKVIRGGSWYFEADSARCALRYTHPPDERGFSLGFRVVREPVGSARQGS